VEFEWDKKKAAENIRKHGISFHEAATVFDDFLAITFDDSEHSIGEDRLLTFGTTRTRKLVIVSHTERNRKMRIISTRLMTKQERNIYENG
jgi:uncharacterized DUF497 family protein